MVARSLDWMRRARSVLVIMSLVAALVVQPAHANSVTYEHDARGRLTKATYSDGTVVTYTYDANGNRIGATVTQPNDTSPPSVPANLSATPVSQTQINVSWSESTDNVGVSGYELERCTGDSCSSFEQIATPTLTSYADTGRSPNTTYRYRVRAVDAADNRSAYSTTATATTPDTTAPTAPGTPTFSNITMTSATASWTAAMDDVGVTGYEYRLNSGAWQTLGNVLSVGLTGLSAATNYTFEVRARDAAGNRGPESSASFTTPDTAPPSAAGTPTFSNVAMNSAIASWAPATDNVGVVGYDYQLNSGAWQSLGNVTSVGLSGLSAATTYTFRVRARDAAGNVGSASSASFTTVDTAAPSVPTGLSATAPTSTTVHLSWTASTDNVAVTGYRVYRNGFQIGTSATNSYTDNTTAGTTTYSYTVRAYDAAGNLSGQSNTATITTPDTIAPSTPSGLSAVAVNPTRVDLSWNASTDTGGSGLAGYRIYRNGSQIATSSSTTYSDTSVSAGGTYSYRVASYDNAGNVSGQSNAMSVTTPVPLVVSVNTTTWSYFFQVGQPPRVSRDVTVSPSGGTGGYSYLWERVSGDTVTTVVNPTSHTTGWSRSIPQFFVTYTSVWRCRVTDTSGNVAYSPNITVTFRAETLELATNGRIREVLAPTFPERMQGPAR